MRANKKIKIEKLDASNQQKAIEHIRENRLSFNKSNEEIVSILLAGEGSKDEYIIEKVYCRIVWLIQELNESLCLNKQQIRLLGLERKEHLKEIIGGLQGALGKFLLHF